MEMYNPFNLSDKIVLITGASSGIGRASAIECSKLGAKVVLIGRNETRLQETISLMDGSGHIFISGDIRLEETINEIVLQIPKLDGVVYCAGVNDKSLVKALSKEKINKVFDTNLFAPMMLTKELLKQKKINASASIVMISSISSYYATISNTMYAASKGALESFIRVLSLEVANRQIRVNGIRPGVVETPLLNAYTLKDELDEFRKQFPLGRFGKPEEIAWGVVYLLSDATKWMTGSIFNIDGGVTLR